MSLSPRGSWVVLDTFLTGRRWGEAGLWRNDHKGKPFGFFSTKFSAVALLECHSWDWGMAGWLGNDAASSPPSLAGGWCTTVPDHVKLGVTRLMRHHIRRDRQTKRESGREEVRTGRKWTTCARMHEHICSPSGCSRAHWNVFCWEWPEGGRNTEPQTQHGSLWFPNVVHIILIFYWSKWVSENKQHLLACPSLKVNVVSIPSSKFALLLKILFSLRFSSENPNNVN